MKLRARSVAWLLPFMLTACFLRKHPAPQKPYAPPPSTVPKPSTAPVELPPSATTIPSQPIVSDSAVLSKLARKTPPRRKKPVNKNGQQATDTGPPAANSAPQSASESPAVSAVGKLSSGDPSDLRRETEESIASTERGLNGIGRTLNDQDQKTASQIREFLREARQALASGDVDGAHTLAAKAKVLLSELAGT